MLLVLLGIIALIYMICVGVKNNSAEKKYEAIKKYNDDYDRKLELRGIEIRKKYYNSSATREISDYILAGKSRPPFKVEIDSENVTAFFSDGSSVGYCYRAHGLQPPLGTELVYPYYSPAKCIPPYEYSIFLHSSEISYQNEFGEALRLRIQDKYKDVDYSVATFSANTSLTQIPTRQF